MDFDPYVCSDLCVYLILSWLIKNNNNNKIKSKIITMKGQRYLETVYWSESETVLWTCMDTSVWCPAVWSSPLESGSDNILPAPVDWHTHAQKHTRQTFFLLFLFWLQCSTCFWFWGSVIVVLWLCVVLLLCTDSAILWFLYFLTFVLVLCVCSSSEVLWWFCGGSVVILWWFYVGSEVLPTHQQTLKLLGLGDVDPTVFLYHFNVLHLVVEPETEKSDLVLLSSEQTCLTTEQTTDPITIKKRFFLFYC